MKSPKNEALFFPSLGVQSIEGILVKMAGKKLLAHYFFVYTLGYRVPEPVAACMGTSRACPTTMQHSGKSAATAADEGMAASFHEEPGLGGWAGVAGDETKYTDLLELGLYCVNSI